MPTRNQLTRKRYRTQHNDNSNHARTRASEHAPQKKGVRPRVLTVSPKKPNSANRKIVLLRLRNRMEVFAHIPGGGECPNEHQLVLIRGGRLKDAPGVKYHCIRGVHDLLGIQDRRSSRSKYGTRKTVVEHWIWPFGG
uniref:Ribosomal protein S12 n=2 Tax=Viscum TaxID=3971 RepID=A0A0H3WIZ6_9MAGN|nr:ribosomal protein S12 [Viscum scurruloideum]